MIRIIKYIVSTYVIVCTVVMTLLLSTLVVEADHGAEHGPGWHSNNCDQQPWQDDQGVVCNMMGLESKILEHHGYKIWEFDDSYIIMYKDQEILQWDCILDSTTTDANRFFCAVMMDYDYDRLESFIYE